MTELEPVIGLEVHVQLATRTKLFCACPNEFGAPPNANACPICAGHPGVLPVPNEAALWLGVRAALALSCEIAERSKFDRKHYFYPDLPKGYQISQFDLPFARGGEVVLSDGRRIGLERIHFEEDAGKSTHVPGATLVDLNRCGVPLIEIVGKPALHTSADAHDYLVNLKRTLRWVGASDCDMEKGSLRVDVNVSLRERGAERLGTKVEIKNVNSFRMVERALDYEIARQRARLAGGSAVRQETRLWDDGRAETRAMRSKEEATDYRYFPEPDIPPIRLPADAVARMRAALPELWAARRARFAAEAGLSDYDASVLTEDRALADYFEATWRACGDAKLAANWIQTDVLRVLAERSTTLAQLPLAPATLATIIDLVKQGTVSTAGARRVFEHVLATEQSPPEAVRALGVAQLSDAGELERVVREVLARTPKAVADYRAGKTKALDAIKGQVMRATAGRANPAMVADLLARLVDEAPEPE